MIMNITIDTKLSEILQQYPWLLDEAVKIDERFKVLNNPVGKMFIKKATIKGLSEKAALDMEVVIKQIQQMIDQHNA